MEKVKAVTAEQARRIIQEEEERGAQECLAEVQTVLHRHGYELRPKLFFTPDGRAAAIVQVVRPEQPPG